MRRAGSRRRAGLPKDGPARAVQIDTLMTTIAFPGE
jgi:hypothetical protein